MKLPETLYKRLNITEEEDTIMLITKLAFRNIYGAGMRTWLNVFVLSLAFVFIIWMQGIIRGMSIQIMRDTIDTEYGGGQYWHAEYDPYDPLTVDDSQAPLSEPLSTFISNGGAAAVLITSGTIFPDGRPQSALLKGIDPGQNIITLPTGEMKSDDPDIIPGLIGNRMAKLTGINIGDYVTVRWRDINGMFDATDILITGRMNTTNPAMDNNQIWLPLEDLRRMIQAPGSASIVIVGKDVTSTPQGNETWIFRNQDFLLKDITDMIKAKSAGVSVFYVLLMSMALLAIFDTQMLSIFRRRKEMGTLMALGMSRSKVIGLFTLEGGLHGFLALLAGAVYGIPFLTWQAKHGFPLPDVTDDFGMAIGNALYPSYGFKIFIVTTLLVLGTVTFVSFLPTRKISKLRPTDALRGKLT